MKVVVLQPRLLVEFLSATFGGKKAMGETQDGSKTSAGASAHFLLAKAGHRSKSGFSDAEKYLPPLGGYSLCNGQGAVFP